VHAAIGHGDYVVRPRQHVVLSARWRRGIAWRGSARQWPLSGGFRGDLDRRELAYSVEKPEIALPPISCESSLQSTTRSANRRSICRLYGPGILRVALETELRSSTFLTSSMSPRGSRERRRSAGHALGGGIRIPAARSNDRASLGYRSLEILHLPATLDWMIELRTFAEQAVLRCPERWPR